MHQALATGKGASGGGGAGTTQSGAASLATNDTSKAVTFPTAFGSTPVVHGQITLADNTQPGIDCWVDESTRSASGVTFLFSAAIPASGFTLNWIAVG